MRVLNRSLHGSPAVVVAMHMAAMLSAGASDPQPATRQPIGYFESIKPLFAIHCLNCHDSEKQKGGLRLDISKGALEGGNSGSPAIVPGASGQSELIRRITSNDPDEKMPPKGTRFTEKEVALIRRWIDEGAKWPDRDEYWAFLPPREPVLPALSGSAVSGNPVDRFINARLETAKIAPVPPADPRTLLRRVYADLLGIPPSPEEAELFLRDPSPGAYEKLIDRLLSDSRYGERWARHWLDLVRYGESDGYEDDKVRPHAWRYRDYVIRSFNVDKPYDRFVQEQIAGDELWPDDPDAWVATGFARAGAWDGMSKEPAQQRQDFLNDATDAVGSIFLGVTIGCAKCHDHKYDVITQQDYYRLQAFFAGAKRESRELSGDLGDPADVREIFKSVTEELARLQNERKELLATGRQEIEKERGAGTTGTSKLKIEEAETVKKVESRHPGRLAEITARTKQLESRQRLHAPAAEVIVEDTSPPPKTFVLRGGQLGRRGAETVPGLIEAMMPAGKAIADLSASGGKRRAALARWLTSQEHPLTARVMVNRLWQHHFGAGIVATPSDFGRNGSQPSHPELLDWLARKFVQEGFSLKKMHRLIMTSDAYRRSSAPDAAASAADPGNKLLWRMNRRRLEAEAIRDTILAVSGGLNPKMGGPGIYAQLPAGVTVELPNNDKELSWGTTSEEDNCRRSVYLFQRRSLTYPLMEVFDGAAMSQTCPVRAQTTVAPQALALFNGEFCREAARQFAGRLRSKAGDETVKQIERAFQIAFTRLPTERERTMAGAFLHEQSERYKADGPSAASSALVDFCHVLLNASELIYPD